jgi:hypothetical protein
MGCQPAPKLAPSSAAAKQHGVFPCLPVIHWLSTAVVRLRACKTAVTLPYSVVRSVKRNVKALVGRHHVSLDSAMQLSVMDANPLI